MNRRQFKKACKKAAAEVQRLMPGVYEFYPSDGDDTLYQQPRYRPPYCSKLDRKYPCPRKGTLLYLHNCGDGEYQPYSAVELLSQVRADIDLGFTLNGSGDV